MLFEIRFYFSQIYQNKQVTLVRPIKINGNEDLEALNFFAKHSNNTGLNKYGTFLLFRISIYNYKLTKNILVLQRPFPKIGYSKKSAGSNDIYYYLYKICSSNTNEAGWIYQILPRYSNKFG